MNRVSKAGFIGFFLLICSIAAAGQSREKAPNELADWERAFAAEAIFLGGVFPKSAARMPKGTISPVKQ